MGCSQKEWEKPLVPIPYHILTKEILKLCLVLDRNLINSVLIMESQNVSRALFLLLDLLHNMVWRVFCLFLMVSHSHLGIYISANYPLSVSCLKNLQCKSLKGCSSWQVWFRIVQSLLHRKAFSFNSALLLCFTAMYLVLVFGYLFFSDILFDTVIQMQTATVNNDVLPSFPPLFGKLCFLKCLLCSLHEDKCYFLSILLNC